MSAAIISINIPDAGAYGASEIKKYQATSTYSGFVLTIAIITLLMLLFFGISSLKKIIPSPKPIPSSIDWTWSNTTKPNTELPPIKTPDVPTSAKATGIGTGYRAGDPVPMSASEIKPNAPGFASIGDMGSSNSAGTLSSGGAFTTGATTSNVIESIKSKPNEEVVLETYEVEEEPYFDLRDLLSKVVYPSIARSANVEGTVVVRVMIGTDGLPKKPSIESSDSMLLNEAAVKAVMACVFTPAKQHGYPVAVWLLIPIQFKLK